MKRRFVAGLAALAVLLVPAFARATPDFPPLIVQDLAIKCDGGASPIWDGLGCTICHLDNNGGLGTVQHPFGLAMKSMYGVSANNESALTSALNAEKTAQNDFNCDGIPDIEELESCQWPMLAMKGSMCGGDGGMGGDGGPPIENIIYGCSASASSSASSVPASIAALLACALLVTHLRAKRRFKGDR